MRFISTFGRDFQLTMDLRAFGVGPRTWLDVLTYQLRDRVLVGVGFAILITSIVLGVMGFVTF